jgi:hypothetical protein
MRRVSHMRTHVGARSSEIVEQKKKKKKRRKEEEI